MGKDWNGIQAIRIGGPPPELGGFLFCGADPAWTPAREAQNPVTCQLCGGMVIDANGFPRPRCEAEGVRDLLVNSELLTHVCACMRTRKRNLTGKLGEGNDEIAESYGPPPGRNSAAQVARTAEAVRQQSKAKTRPKNKGRK